MGPQRGQPRVVLGAKKDVLTGRRLRRDAGRPGRAPTTVSALTRHPFEARKPPAPRAKRGPPVRPCAGGQGESGRVKMKNLLR